MESGKAARGWAVKRGLFATLEFQVSIETGFEQEFAAARTRKLLTERIGRVHPFALKGAPRSGRETHLIACKRQNERD